MHHRRSADVVLCWVGTGHHRDWGGAGLGSDMSTHRREAIVGRNTTTSLAVVAAEDGLG